MTDKSKLSLQSVNQDSSERAVIFDMDGCLVDSEPVSLASIAEEMRAIGIPYADARSVATQFLGIGMSDICSRIEATTGIPCPEDFSHRVETRTIETYRSSLKRMPDLDQVLNILGARNYHIALATGASKRRLGVTLQISGLDQIFAGKTTNIDEVENGKPAPDVFLLSAERIGVSPKNCIVVEDSPNGIKAARAAGMFPVGFVGGSHLDDFREDHIQTLMQAGAMIVLTSLLDLPSILETTEIGPSSGDQARARARQDQYKGAKS